MKSPYLFVFLLLHFVVAAQQGFKTPDYDSLSEKTFNELTEKIDSYKAKKGNRKLYINTYIVKAKREKDIRKLIQGYNRAIDYSHEKEALKYCDTLLNLAHSLKDDKLIGRGYIDKAVVYYTSKDYHKSLEYYLIADKYITEKNDIYTKYKIKYGIANIKYYLGIENEAIQLFQECTDFYGSREGYNNRLGYLYSIRSVGKCYFKLGEFDKSSDIYKTGIEKSREEDLVVIHNYFLQSEGISQFAKKNYKQSIKYLLQSLPEITKNEDFLNISLSNLFLGKNYLKLGKEKTGISYLQKVDSVLQKHHYANLDLRETYELFINYYKKKSDLENQLKYTNRLLEADRILEKNYKNLISTIYKEYDTAQLIASKHFLEKTLYRNTIISYFIYGLSALIIIIISYFLVANYKKQKTYRLKYNELIAKTNEREKHPEAPITASKTTPDGLDINKEIISKILKDLGDFEKKREYLNTGITQSALAEELETNTTYLSKIINHYKEKNFNSYLNELRINHAVILLKNSPTHRRYTIKALAEELGFSNPRSFSDAFFSQTGIKPSYFIKQIEKEAGLLPEG